MSDDPCFLSATDLRRRISRKEISPVEVTRAVLARAEDLQPHLNCFITLCSDEAMAQAEAAERKVMAGEPLGLLHGVPVTVKDIVNTKGVKTTFGAVPYRDNVPGEDAVAVARLRAHGAILIAQDRLIVVLEVRERAARDVLAAQISVHQVLILTDQRRVHEDVRVIHHVVVLKP